MLQVAIGLQDWAKVSNVTFEKSWRFQRRVSIQGQGSKQGFSDEVKVLK